MFGALPRIDWYEPELVDSPMIFGHIKKVNSRLLLSLWLAFLLLFAQQGAVLHALSHLSKSESSESQQDKHLPHSPACGKCVAYTQVGGGMAVSALAILDHQSVPEYVASLPAAHFSRLFPAYSSRAPPTLV